MSNNPRNFILPRLITMGVLLLTCIGLEYYFHIVRGVVIVYTHIFYVPIIVASLWWGLKGGLSVSLFLGVMHTLSDLPGITESVVVRSVAMVVVGSVMGELSGRYKRSEKKLKQYAEQLERANILLKEADRLKSIFLASMSHELRTPLNSIIGFTGIILQGMTGELNDEQKKQLTLVKKSAHHLLGLINDLLDISKIEARKAELSLDEFMLNDVAKEVVEAFLPALNQKGLKLLVKIPEDITFFSDKRRVKQVLMNLVSNSVKFTDQGSVKIAAEILKNDKVEMRVTDTGIGIKKENMDKLFLPFQQIDMTLTKAHIGTGLGLHLTQKLVNLLGGDISAKSEYGRGSEFTFTLPLKYKEERRGEEDISG